MDLCKIVSLSQKQSNTIHTKLASKDSYPNPSNKNRDFIIKSQLNLRLPKKKKMIKNLEQVCCQVGLMPEVESFNDTLFYSYKLY